MIVFSDLHLTSDSTEICFKVLEYIGSIALADVDRHVVFCGDFWHLRYRVDVRLLNQVYEIFSKWSEAGIRLDLVPGNHDQVTVNGQNALEVLGAISGVTVWTNGGSFGRYGFIPFRKDREDQQKLIDVVLGNKQNHIIFGHFGAWGASMNNRKKNTDGIQLPSLGSRLLILGHYHTHHTFAKNCVYVGSSYQTNFAGAGDICGYIEITADRWGFHPIELGFPKHYIFNWDPIKSADPPQMSKVVQEHDHVRIDIQGDPKLLGSKEFKQKLKKAKYGNAAVEITAVQTERENRFMLMGGESLVDAADRFLDQQDTGDIRQSLSNALRRWV